MHRRLSVTLHAVVRLTLVTTAVSATVVVAGGTAVWRLERGQPGSTFRTWGDGIWWALTTMTTVGYGDHVPQTTLGRVVAGVIMVTGVAVLGAVAAAVALIGASAVALREERLLAAEGRTIEARLDAIDSRLTAIEEQLMGTRREDAARPTVR